MLVLIPVFSNMGHLYSIRVSGPMYISSNHIDVCMNRVKRVVLDCEVNLFDFVEYLK